MDMKSIEHELLLSALDEDALLSASENIVTNSTDVETKDVVALAGQLASRGFLEIYVYDKNQTPVLIRLENLLTKLREEPYGVFLQQTEMTALRLISLDQERNPSSSA